MLTLLKLYRAIGYYVSQPHVQSQGSDDAQVAAPKVSLSIAEIKQADSC